MSRRTSVALIAAFLLWISTPALACLAQPEHMTEAEMQCCREMAGQCGEMAKAEHSCCPKSPVKAQTEKKTVLAVVEKYSAPVAMVVVHNAIGVSTTRGPAFSAPRIASAAESPPGAPLPLRI